MKRAIQLVFTFSFCIFSGLALAYPTKPITIIVPQAPGGTNDLVGRVVAQRLGDQMKASVIVEDRPGAGVILALNLLLMHLKMAIRS